MKARPRYPGWSGAQQEKHSHRQQRQEAIPQGAHPLDQEEQGQQRLQLQDRDQGDGQTVAAYRVEGDHKPEQERDRAHAEADEVVRSPARPVPRGYDALSDNERSFLTDPADANAPDPGRSVPAD